MAKEIQHERDTEVQNAVAREQTVDDAMAAAEAQAKAFSLNKHSAALDKKVKEVASVKADAYKTIATGIPQPPS